MRPVIWFYQVQWIDFATIEINTDQKSYKLCDYILDYPFNHGVGIDAHELIQSLNFLLAKKSQVQKL